MNLYGKAWPTLHRRLRHGRVQGRRTGRRRGDGAPVRRTRTPTVELSRDTFERALPRIVSILEEPIASSSIVPMFFVCERARRDVKVALDRPGTRRTLLAATRATWACSTGRTGASCPAGCAAALEPASAAAAQRGAQARRVRARRRRSARALPQRVLADARRRG